mmetsp:Transcript_8755/g.11024  ORF Transcript_8755/g.11024 Transcript_8755/m.11024 type:complete len:153 (+) Transcript_8755:212-670(+)
MVLNNLIKCVITITLSMVWSVSVTNAFSIMTPKHVAISRLSRGDICEFQLTSSTKLFANEVDDELLETAERGSETAKKSLEEKMKDWEASEEEMKNASLGGLVPSSGERTDGFDIGLLLAFPFIVGSALLFAVFPFIMDKIDVSSVGPPPTV